MPTAYRPNRICVHRGPAVPGRFFLGERKDGTRVEVPVFGCALKGGCTIRAVPEPVPSCESCPDYDHAPTHVVVPKPPEWAGTPRSKRAVATVVVGEEAEALHDAAHPLLRLYADRLEADLVVLRWPGCGASWPMSSKFAVATLLGPYERVAYLDADALPLPGCPDLFAATPGGTFGAFDESGVGDANHDRRLDRWVSFRYDHGFKTVPGTVPGTRHRTQDDPGGSGRRWPTPFYFNAGVMVLEPRHRHLVEAPDFPIIPDHCAEQDLTNARLHDSFLGEMGDGDRRVLGRDRLDKVKVTLLPKSCNHMWWTDPEFASVRPDEPPILHWAGRGVKQFRVARVRDKVREVLGDVNRLGTTL